MKNRQNRLIRTLLFATSLLLLTACGGDSGTKPKEDPAPSFRIASVKVQCNTGDECIRFFAKPDTDVLLVKVIIRPPAGDAITFNAGSDTFIKEEDVALQDANVAYFRVSGQWTFTFVGNHATGNKSSFEVVTTVDVSA